MSSFREKAAGFFSRCPTTVYQQPTVRDEDEELRLEAGLSVDEWHNFASPRENSGPMETKVEMVFDMDEAESHTSSQTSTSSGFSAMSTPDTRCVSPATTIDDEESPIAVSAGQKRKRGCSGEHEVTELANDCAYSAIDAERTGSTSSSRTSSPHDSKLHCLYVDENGGTHAVLTPRDDQMFNDESAARPGTIYVDTDGRNHNLASFTRCSKRDTRNKAASISTQTKLLSEAPCWDTSPDAEYDPFTNPACYYVARDGTMYNSPSPQHESN